MNRGIGVTWPTLGRVTSSYAGVIAAAVALMAAIPAGVFAAEPTAADRFSERSLMDAARSAVTTTEGRPVNIGIPPADELRVLQSRREAELKRLSDKLRRAAEARGPRPAEVITTPEWTTDVASASPAELDTSQRSALGAPDAAGLNALGQAHGTATILMVITAPDGRSAQRDRAADPIMCVTTGCYVSNGAQAPATFLSFEQSLSVGARIGRGAGSCNHTDVCVFRNVDLGPAAALVQPVDLKLLRHDRREQREATIDGSCRVIEGKLSCSRPVRTASYTLWVVPEHVARDVGPEMLAAAVGDGLKTARTAELPWVTTQR